MIRVKNSIIVVVLLFAFVQTVFGQESYTHTIGWGDATEADGVYTNFTSASGEIQGICSFSTAQNSSSTAPAYNESSNELRLYYGGANNGSSITITPITGVVITGAVITKSPDPYSQYTPLVAYRVGNGDFHDVTLNDNDNTYSISGIEASSSTPLEIKNVSTNNEQLRIKKIALTYTFNGQTPTYHTVTFSAGEGVFIANDDFQATTNIKLANTEYVLPSAGRTGYHFDGWTMAGNNTPVTGNYTVTSDVNFIASYSPNEHRWVSTSFSALTGSDVFVIVCNNNNGSGHYALSNSNGVRSAPTAVAVLVDQNEIANNVDDDIKWTVSGNATDGYIFRPYGSTDNLYCSNNNNGVRVGMNDANKLFLMENNYLKNIATSRYLGVYNSQDWRCYIDYNVNISGQTFTFYKKESVNISDCNPITIPLGGSWTENFENFEPEIETKTNLRSTAANDWKAFRMDDGCWDELLDNGNPTVCNPVLYTEFHMNALGGAVHADNSVSVQFYNKVGPDPCTLILPEFVNDLSALQFSFKGCYYDLSGTLQVGYYYNGNFVSTTGDGFTITVTRNANPSDANFGPYTFAGAPSGSRIALRYTPQSNHGCINLDEFVVTNGNSISSVADWNLFASSVNDGTDDYSGKTVYLDADIAVSTMVGTEAHPFSGTFDGQGHTLHVNISGVSEQGAAPFHYISGATIRNLVVTGSSAASNGSYPHASGLVGFAWSGTNTIENCLVHTNVSARGSESDNTHIGGIVGHAKSSTVVLNGCVYDGQLSSRYDYIGGLIGWADNVTFQLTNCLFNGRVVDYDNFHPIGCCNNFNYINSGSSFVHNCYYYATNGVFDKMGDAYTNSLVALFVGNAFGSGERAYRISGDEGVSVENAGATTAYSVSGITAYGTGIKYQNKLFAGEDEVVSLNLGYSGNSEFYGYTVDNGTLSGSGNPYSLTMPESDVMISIDRNCPKPTDLAVSGVSYDEATVSWSGIANGHNLRYRETQDAIVTLIVGDIWGDGSGYQMLLDPDYNTYGRIIPTVGPLTNGGDASSELYNEFEYRIPYDADGSCNTQNIVLNNSVTIRIPAGTYDWCITNPTPGNRVWIASAYGSIAGRQDDFVFEAGKTYEFTVSYDDGYDIVSLTIDGNSSGANSGFDWTVVENATSPYTIENLNEGTNYEVQVQGVCNVDNGESVWSSSVFFGTPSHCATPSLLKANNFTPLSATLNWTGNQESYNVKYRSAAYTGTYFYEDFEGGEIPEGWTLYSQGQQCATAQPWVVDNISSSHPQTDGIFAARSYSYLDDNPYNVDNWLISPRLDLRGTLKCWVYTYSDSWADEYEVLLSTAENVSPANLVTDFSTVLQERTAASEGWHQISIDLSAFAGQQGYIAIRHVYEDGYYLDIDDFGLFGDVLPAGEWVNVTTNASSYNIGNLSSNTQYEWQVQGIYAGCDGGVTSWSESSFFTTPRGLIFTRNGDWNVETNWTPVGLPTKKDNVYIAAEATIPSEYLAQYKSITIEEGGELIASSSLPVTVRKSVDANKWYAIAAPVITSGMTSLGINATNLTIGTYDLFGYNEATGTWINQKAHNDFTFVSGQGYIYRRNANNTLTFEGVTTVDDVSILLTANGSGDIAGFNLVGNPYPHNVTLNRAFYSLEADGRWVEHTHGGTLAVGQSALVHVISQETLTYSAATRNTNLGTKGYLPPLPKGLCLSDECEQDTQNTQNANSTRFAYQDGDQLVINGTGTLQVFDVLGRQLFNFEIRNSKFEIHNSQFPGTGVYILRLNEKTQKIVIK